MAKSIKKTSHKPNTKKTNLLVIEASSQPDNNKTPAVSGFPVSSEDKQAIDRTLLISRTEYGRAKLRDIVIKDKEKDLEVLDNIIKEYLSAFIIVGYDLNGRQIEFITASTPVEYDALFTRYNSIASMIRDNMAKTNGTDTYGVNA